MADPKKPSAPSLASIEANLFSGLIGLQQQITTRLREESLSDEQKRLVVDRLGVVIQSEIDDMKQAKDLDITKRMESVSTQINQFIDELSESE